MNSGAEGSTLGGGVSNSSNNSRNNRSQSFLDGGTNGVEEVDDYSRFTWVKCLRSKDEAPDFIIKFFKMIQVRLKVGISHETSVALSPHQNGVVERRNRTLIKAARTMTLKLLFVNTPASFAIRRCRSADRISRKQSIHPVSRRYDGVLSYLQGLVRGLPKLKFKKDHLRSAGAMGKSKKKSHKPKSEDINQEKLYLLHMDLCGPMRVKSVNGKKKPIPLESNTPKHVVTLVYSRKPKESRNNVPVSKSKIDKSLSTDKKEPNKSWRSTVSNVPSFSTVECRLSKLFSGIWTLAAPRT
nr:integrase, catalytic region, zinc finger, CCHC-type, peptidase aspartic, catalytic [Tanacetum cinerariifolium]